jgi:hypothetical protein
MTDLDHPPRRYGETEVARILRRATELQQEEPVLARGREGLSLAELEEIGAEVGIDPQFLRRAAVELDSTAGEPSGWARVLGERVTLLQETVVPGELGEGGFERLVPVIQEVAEDFGQASLLGRTLTWRAETASKTRSLQVMVTSRNGETHIRVEERLHQFASGLFGGTLGGVGGGVGLGVGLPVGIEVLGSALFATAFPLGILGITFLTARKIYQAVARRRKKVLALLLQRLADAVADDVAEGPPPALDRGSPLPGQ